MTSPTETLQLTRQRRFVTPAAGETLEDIAARALADVPTKDAADRLRSWNLHVFALRKPAGLLLCSDVIFVEPPLA